MREQGQQGQQQGPQGQLGQGVAAALGQLSAAAVRLEGASGGAAEEALRAYINCYVQNKRRSEEFFMHFCESGVLGRLLGSKGVPALGVLELLHLLVSNSAHDELVYVFSQGAVHEWLFERFSIYRERDDAVEYYVQLLKTLILRAAAPGSHSLLRLFCNKRFPAFPLLTTVTLLAASQTVDELARITAQQCVLLLTTLINTAATGLVYLNELQMVVFFYELVRQMLAEDNPDREGSIKYFVDLAGTLAPNRTSRYLLFNLLGNCLFFPRRCPAGILRFIRELGELAAEHPALRADPALPTLYRIFRKYYCAQHINATYHHAQRILPALTIPAQPRLLNFYAHRCRRIDEYLVNEGDYERAESGNDCLLDEWLEFNDNPDPSPVRSPKKNAFAEFFSSQEDAVDRYIHGVMTMAGLEVEKLKSPIIKLTFSSDFKTSLFLAEAITANAHHHEDFYRDPCWTLRPKEELFVEVYLLYLSVQAASTVILEEEAGRLEAEAGRLEAESALVEALRPQLARLVAEELCGESINLSKNYLLLLFKLVVRLRLVGSLEPRMVEALLGKLLDLQRLIGETTFVEEAFPSLLRYVLRNQERPYTRDKIDAAGLKSGKVKLGRPKQARLEHLLFYYEVIQRFLDPSLKALNEFVEDYWRLGFHGGQSYRALMAARDTHGNYLEVYATDRLEFEVRLGEDRFTLRDGDLAEAEAASSALQFGQLKAAVEMASAEAAQNFRKDVWGVRETRKEIFRQAVLEYMPFIYDSIEVRYRSHHPSPPASLRPHSASCTPR